VDVGAAVDVVGVGLGGGMSASTNAVTRATGGPAWGPG
jgi:hypothetical protein